MKSRKLKFGTRCSQEDNGPDQDPAKGRTVPCENGGRVAEWSTQNYVKNSKGAYPYPSAEIVPFYSPIAQVLILAQMGQTGLPRNIVTVLLASLQTKAEMIPWP